MDGPGEGEGADKPEGGEPTPPAEGSGGTETNPQYQGEQGAPTD